MLTLSSRAVMRKSLSLRVSFDRSFSTVRVLSNRGLSDFATSWSQMSSTSTYLDKQRCLSSVNHASFTRIWDSPRLRGSNANFKHSQIRFITHYERLGITPPSNAKEIKLAYFKKAKGCHPDIHGESKTKEFQELSAAYAVLSDEKKKAAYDASGYQDRNYDTPSQGGQQYGHYEKPPDMDDAFRMFRDVFNEFGVQDYFTTLQQEVQKAYAEATNPVARKFAERNPPETPPKFDIEPLWDLAKRRKGLVLGVLVPSIVIFRHPVLAVAFLRILAGGAAVLFQIVARNPALQRMIGAYLWKKVVEFAEKSSGGSSNDTSDKGSQGSTSKNSNANNTKRGARKR